MSPPASMKHRGGVNKGRLIIISAPSGTGKTSVIHRFLKKHPNMMHSISCTTRSTRVGEKEAQDYHFVTEEKFQEMIDHQEFAEWAEVHGHHYGTLRAPIDKALEEGKDVLLDLDVQGGMNLKKMYGDKAISIFLLPPSPEELEKRLSRRGTDSPESRKIRLENAKKEIRFRDHYDFQVINDELESACGEIETILNES